MNQPWIMTHVCIVSFIFKERKKVQAWISRVHSNVFSLSTKNLLLSLVLGLHIRWECSSRPTRLSQEDTVVCKPCHNYDQHIYVSFSEIPIIKSKWVGHLTSQWCGTQTLSGTSRRALVWRLLITCPTQGSTNTVGKINLVVNFGQTFENFSEIFEIEK